MFSSGKTVIEDLPQVWEVPNIIPEERRAALFELINQSYDELSDLFHPTKPPWLADLGIAAVSAQGTKWVWRVLSSLHDWFVAFLRTDSPPVNAYAIETTVRQLEGIGAFLVGEAWAQLRGVARRLGATDEEVTAHGRGILLEANKRLILIVQAFRDWAEENRPKPPKKPRTGGRKGKASGKKRSCGRPRTTDPADDERLYNDWKSSSLTQKEFERQRNVPHGKVRRIATRIRRRKQQCAQNPVK